MTNNTHLSVLAAQFPISLSIRQNLETILGILDHAQPGDIVLFPEGSVSGYSHDLSFLDEIDQQELHAALERLRDEARKRGIHLWVGACTLEGSRWFNSAFGFTPGGETYIYRKINLATHERGVLTPGADLPVFMLSTSAGLVTVGIQICREIRYPEQWGWLARQGAQLILHLNNAVGDDSHQPVWHSHLISRAAETQRFVVSANNAAPQQVSPTIAVAPDGQVLAEIVSGGCEFFRVKLDLALVSNWYLDQCRSDVVAIEAPKEDDRAVEPMNLAKLQADFEELQNNPALFEDANFNARTEALDFITLIEEMFRARKKDGSLGISGVDGICGGVLRAEHAKHPHIYPLPRQFPGSQKDKILANLYTQAQKLRYQLEEKNERLFQQLREEIQSGNYTIERLRRQFDLYTDYRPEKIGQPHYGYEDLDGLIAGVFLSKSPPDETLERVPGMVRYQPTPASAILELIDQIDFSHDDVFYDLGSGLGQVVALVNLLTGVRSVGVEFEPVYCDYASQRADELGLRNISFINADARDAEYSDGTVFFMFNPFGGKIFDAVLEKLRQEAGKRSLTICSYGSCTPHIAEQPWLQILDQRTNHEFKLAIFKSR